MKTTKIKKILIANRGEIALRIIRACKELEIKSVVVFSEVDMNGVWVRKADECYPIMGDPIAAYLDYERIISLAKKPIVMRSIRDTGFYRRVQNSLRRVSITELSSSDPNLSISPFSEIKWRLKWR